MSKKADAGHMLTWDDESLAILGVEVATAAVEYAYFDGYGPSKVWELSATFRSAAEPTGEIPNFAVTVAVLDELGIELNKVTEATRRGKGPFLGTSSLRLVAYPSNDESTKRVRHLVASVSPSAPHPDEPPLNLHADFDAALMLNAGIDISMLRATASASSFDTQTDVSIIVRATVDAAAQPELKVQGLDAEGLPDGGMWLPIYLMSDAGSAGNYVGEATVRSPVLPTRITLAPWRPGIELQAAAMLEVESGSLAQSIDVVATAASIAGEPESVTVRLSGTMSNSDDNAAIPSDDFPLLIEVMSDTRLMWTHTEHLLQPGQVPAPVVIEFSVFRADRHEFPTSLRLSSPRP